MMADVVWARSQRMARQRELALGGIAGRWWRAVAAALLSAFYLFVMVQDLPEYGLRSAYVPIASVALLAVGTMLRPTTPRMAAVAVVLGAAPATLAWWAPGLPALAILTIVGVFTETLGLAIRGQAGRVVAGLTIAILVFASFGTLLLGWGYHWPAVGYGSVAVLAFTGRRRPSPG
jgi:hypothetical protein